MPKRLSEYLVLEEGKVKCSRCGWELSSLEGEEWKEGARVKEGPLRKACPLMPDDGRMVVREFICPGCATLLDVEVVMKEKRRVD